jgi:hypothetical protein
MITEATRPQWAKLSIFKLDECQEHHMSREISRTSHADNGHILTNCPCLLSITVVLFQEGTPRLVPLEPNSMIQIGEQLLNVELRSPFTMHFALSVSELLTHIFGYSDKKSNSNNVCVCKGWYDSCLPVFWRDLIKKSDFVRLFSILGPVSDYYVGICALL